MSKKSPDLLLNRREFLQTTPFLALLAAALFAPHFLPADVIKETKLEGPLTLGKLKLYTLSTEHTAQDWQANQALITQIIQKVDLVIPEYFPPEYRYWLKTTNPIMQLAVDAYAKANVLFDEVEKLCVQENKELWVVDPAYGSEFVLLRSTLQEPEALAETAAIWYWLRRRLGPIAEGNSLTIFRRRFIIALGTFLGINTLMWLLKPDLVISQLTSAVDNVRPVPSTLLEQDLRRVVIAEQLWQLGQRLPSTKQAVTIYPEAHLKIIRYYLTHQRERRIRLQLYQKVFDGGVFSPLFAARNYQRYQDTWQRQNDYKLPRL